MSRTPQLYVEVPKEECLEGRRVKHDCIVIQDNIEVRLREGEEVPEFIQVDKAKFLAKEIYDRFHFYVDHYEHRMKVDAIIVYPDRRTKIYLKKGDELLLLPVEGYVVTLIADVGNRVRKGDAFAAVTTRKGEVHYLKPPKPGTVVYIDEFTNRPHYIYYILPEF
ncbi:DUF2118 domain-containing protein [Pyrococcus furiosus DSM 3638]|uniref:DUF2118 domain-containing protein n=3 Tax=Pyrococcus furiosus TaxID=2261 RepID=Q8U1K5_PYRFU|nr:MULTISPECIES: DUF2118 family protein [Pyrococcus]AAL81325.1 hypothetical protein PF1201 [Pyrococcus furiosus DSM 3638]AFN03991.1 hypothetical protein PFC_05220 [Pyrococcus furiosus COM1]MDK2870455.1 hypothetical protein [Pyrococcus sp.]QEK78853.1 DUF2118 domain-containing protein [Pyrococcus furiosus DSM 3638]